MPTPKSRRDVILKTSVAAGDVSNLTILMDASFTTSLTGTSITYEDESSTTPEEKTKYKMVFANVGGASIGCITLKLVGNPEPDVTATITKTDRFDFNPSGTAGTVQLLDPATHSYERVWKQAVMRERDQMVDNVAKIDMRVTAGTGYTVSQSVGTNTDNELVINYSWVDPAVGAVVSGSVRFDSSVTAYTGYTLANIRITDTDSGGARMKRR